MTALKITEEGGFAKMTKLPLEGIRVMSFGPAIAGPLASRILADWGAEVIKVESKGKLDTYRFVGTLVTNPTTFEETIDSSGFFIDTNHGTKNIQANLKKPEAIQLLQKLAAITDVLIENYAPRVLSGLGLGYEDLKKINPGIIMCSLSAVGQTGPLRDIKSYGPSVASLTGMQSLLGYQDGEISMDVAIPDYINANNGAFFILAALHYRKRTGKGSYIDMGQVAPTIQFLGEPFMDYTMNNRVAKMQGNWRDGYVPHNQYRCKPNPEKQYPEDEFVSIAVKTEEEWRCLCNAMGNPAWTKGPKFSNRLERLKNQAELDKHINEWTIKQTPYEVTAILQKAGVAAAPVADLDLRMHDIQAVARESFRFMDTTYVPKVPFATPGIKFSNSSYRWQRPSNLGEDNDYVYGKLLHMTKEEIARLVAEEVIL